MATDRKGNEIEVGDVVAIPCVVKDITEGVQHHLVLESLYPMPDGAPSRFALNEQQVFKSIHPDNREEAENAIEQARARALAMKTPEDVARIKQSISGGSQGQGPSKVEDPDSGDPGDVDVPSTGAKS